MRKNSSVIMSISKSVIIIISCLFVNNDAARILAMFPAPSISHQIVFRPLIKELVNRGHEVVHITTDPIFEKDRAPVNLTEIDVHDISYNMWRKELKAGKISGRKDDFYEQFESFIKLLVELTEHQFLVDEVQKVLKDKSQKFDLLILEAYFLSTLGLSHIYKAPVIQICSFGMPEPNLSIVGAEFHPLLYPTSTHQRVNNLTLIEKIKELYNRHHIGGVYARAEKLGNDIIKRVFGPEIPPISELKNNVDMLFLNVHSIWEMNRPVPPNVIYMGGVHQNPEKELPQDLKKYLDSSKLGVIYISFGTNVEPSLLPPEKIQGMINVVSKLPYDVLWKWNQDELPGRTPNIRISKWLPQSDLLRHPKVKLFITQAGLQSTDEAITAGVPLIGMPMLGDQWFNAEQYEYHKIGIRIDMDTMTEEKLTNAINTILKDDSYRQNILHLGELMRDQPQSPLERAVWWTEYVIRHSGARHLRAPAANMPWHQYLELELVTYVILGILSVITLVVVFLYYLMSICSEIEGHVDKVQTKDLFLKVKQLTGTFKPKSWIVDDNRGNTLTELEDVLDRWRNYCYELYRDEEGHTVERRWDEHAREPDIMLSEVHDATNKLKHKALGPDGVSAAMLQHLGDEGTTIIHRICSKIWRTGQWPDDWTQSAVVPLHKKGSTRKCENYRTLSLMSHASKIMLRIINTRLSSFVDHQIPSEQSGFVAGKGTREQILNVRILIEKCREFNKSLVLCFIDYAKAFDCVQWKTMFDVLVEMGVPPHLVFLIQNLYLDGSGFVKLENQKSKSFHTERGVRQGCILSPKLFNLYGEYIMRKALEGWDGGVAVGGRRVSNLRYADDTTIVASSEVEMATILKKIEVESAKLGLKINHSKTKIMVVDRAQILPDTDALDGYEKVSEFVYLGSLITCDGSCTGEIRRRAGMAKSAMTNLDKIWKNRGIRRTTKVRLVRALVFSIFMYGAETWSLRSRDSSKIDAFEMWCWRKLLRIPWTAMRTNESILKELNVTTRLSTICLKRTLGFFGHIMRSQRHCLEKQIILGQMEGRRARGRAPTRWSDAVKKTVGGSLHRAVHTAHDRSRWNAICGRDPHQ